MFLNKDKFNGEISFEKILLFCLVFISLALIFSCSIGHASAAGNTIYVSSGGSDSNSGHSLSTAKKTIKSAAKTVQSGGTIYIGKGTYSGSGNTDINITKNMIIKGASPSNTIIDTKNTNRIFTINSGVKVTIANLTLKNGKTTHDGGSILNYGTLKVTSCKFTGNKADEGGAIYNQDTLTVNHSTFTGNKATLGGAIYHLAGTIRVTNTYSELSKLLSSTTATEGTLLVTSSTFTSNIATRGGAIFSVGTSAVTKSTFTSNTASYGGAIYIASLKIPTATFSFAEVSNLSVASSTFTGNKAYGNGGAIYNSSTLKIAYSTFIKNTAKTKGAIYTTGKLTTISNKFSGNSS